MAESFATAMYAGAVLYLHTYVKRIKKCIS
jgi:hypothetical protein